MSGRGKKNFVFTATTSLNEAEIIDLVASIYRALHSSKLDIGYCQTTGHIVNLKSGYWILATENGMLGYWVH